LEEALYLYHFFVFRTFVENNFRNCLNIPPKIDRGYVVTSQEATMDNLDVIATIDMIFDHLVHRLHNDGRISYDALQDARKVAKVVAVRSYIDNGDVVQALLPKNVQLL